MDLQFWPGAVVMILVATLPASLVTNCRRSSLFFGEYCRSLRPAVLTLLPPLPLLLIMLSIEELLDRLMKVAFRKCQAQPYHQP